MTWRLFSSPTGTTMLAHHQGELLDQSKLAGSLAISGQTVGRYIDLLCDLMLVRRLPAWSGNGGKRLVRAPKVYVRDSGLVHALLAAAPQAQANFYRTSHGAEADLVLTFRSGETWVLEIKRSSAPTVSRGYHLAAADVQATRKLLVAPVDNAYHIKDGIEVMSPLAAASLIAKMVQVS